ncbi:MerR family transcriptional regulator [Streptomyces caeni]|uniref:MerR family transcriptional regulator n=1 Tax=Streptomyces caeni TaxID=2307231 RepID=A0ABW4ISH5_9ACTN
MNASVSPGKPSRPRTVPTELAALAMGVSPATIRKWASRGKLTRHGTPHRAEYDLEELRALTAESLPSTSAPSPRQ